jgi:hypothetical protein
METTIDISNKNWNSHNFYWNIIQEKPKHIYYVTFYGGIFDKNPTEKWREDIKKTFDKLDFVEMAIMYFPNEKEIPIFVLKRDSYEEYFGKQPNK